MRLLEEQIIVDSYDDFPRVPESRRALARG